MKSLYFNRLLLFVFVAVVGFGCSKDDGDNVKPKIQPTSLEITVKNNLGSIVSGASAKLYASKTDWQNGTNQIGVTQISDASGKVKFEDLSDIIYYWHIEKDCQNNINGAVTTTSKLTSNVNNTLDIILSTTGTLKFENKSNNPYSVFINGIAAFDMNGKSTHTLSYQPTGGYSIKVVQKSGYVLYPTEEIYSFTLSCGQTSIIAFPEN